MPDAPPRVFTVRQVDTIDLLKSNTDHSFMSTSFRLSFDLAHLPACYIYFINTILSYNIETSEIGVPTALEQPLSLIKQTISYQPHHIGLATVVATSKYVHMSIH